ncbi:MAG: isoaspartyl peptidase/L-asparaginase [Ignavibacteria bacterium]|nr:isoaspartyl peptidase/L-asparaginase [Ignavibacteria bacterium]MBI3765241.1 isoaspartyl peptidase/L-asparaginase [Ignavibacteriales bacterium]
MPKINRRHFLKAAALTGASAVSTRLLHADGLRSSSKGPIGKPIAISSSNGTRALERVMEMILQGSDSLDAVISGVNIVEDDPNDTSVGYGGLPNEDGVVELDAAVMHGPSYRAGAVAALRNIKNPSKVARLVMERSDHVLIVGEGALKFARAHGFKEENLLTDESREAWLQWKENLSNQDDWLPPHSLEDTDIGQLYQKYLRHYGTIHCSALDMNGNLSCTTTTSGLAYKISGRVGDSGIIGAGLYCDNEVGSAGSTGRGEANLLNCSSVMIVEWMRQGKSPEEACLLACKRVNERCREKRLQDEEGRFKFDIKFYAINKRGEHGSASIWSGGQYLIHDGTQVQTLDCSYLFKHK